MKEIKAILYAYSQIEKGRRAALATVVRVEGSSYRRTGARMLVLDNGTWTGGISGGCLEGDALKRARLAIHNSSTTLITYDTTDDDPHQIGVGLGCNGIIDVLFTPLDLNDKNNPVEILKSCVDDSRDTHILINVTALEGTWNNVKTGQLIRYTGAESLSSFDSTDVQSQIEEHINNHHSGAFQFKSSARTLDIFIEILPPEISVILMGHQYDVYPMSRLLKELGWRITICGDMLKINQHIRAFVDELLPASEFESLHIDNHTAVILMSHDFQTDKRNLKTSLGTPAGFIGMLGPRVRSEKILTELTAEGTIINNQDLARIHAPVGLDIGAVNPEEIALSMAAGVKAAFAGRDGKFLKYRDSPIHPRNT